MNNHLLLFGSAGTITSPTQISNCLLYLDPTLGITQSAGVVSEWLDQSGNGNVMIPQSGYNGFAYSSNIFGTLPGLLSSTANTTSMILSSAVGASQMTLVGLFQANAALNAGSSWGQYWNYSDPSGVSSNSLMIPNESQGANYFILEDGNNNNAIEYFSTPTNFWLTGTNYLFFIATGPNPLSGYAYVNNVGQTSIRYSQGSSWNLNVDTLGCLSRVNRFNDGYYGPQLIYGSTLNFAQIASLTNWYQPWLQA